MYLHDLNSSSASNVQCSYTLKNSKPLHFLVNLNDVVVQLK